MLPELPEARRNRYVTAYDLPVYDAIVLTATREMADFFESAVKQLPSQAKLCANWIMGEVSGRLNKEGIEILDCPINPAQLATLLERVSDETISGKTAKDVFDSMWHGEHDGNADAIIQNKGLKQISDSGEIEKLIDGILIANPQQVEDYRSGKEKAFNSLVGQVMKATRGKANPAQVNTILKQKLS